jgi:hypothetical protein
MNKPSPTEMFLPSLFIRDAIYIVLNDIATVV